MINCLCTYKNIKSKYKIMEFNIYLLLLFIHNSILNNINMNMISSIFGGPQTPR